MKHLFSAILTFAITSMSLMAIAHNNTNSHTEDNKHFWLKFKAKDKYERSTVADLGLEIESIVEDSVAAIGNQEDLENAKKSGLLETYFELTPLMTDFPDHDQNFHNYNELKNELEKLAQENPELVKLSTLGTSIEGRDIFLVTISAAQNPEQVPGVFFMGGHHAREHISVEVPLLFAKYLVGEYRANNKRVQSLLAHRSVYIAPLINPDGAEHDVATGSYRLWRKNRRNNGGSYGVDLNRNYGFQWGGGGASTNPRNDTYRGPNAFSEPETQAVKKFLETHDNISINLSFHTFSELILYPWGHKYDRIENQNDFQVHKTMAETMAKWNGYKPQQSSGLYIASGDTSDWAYGQLGLISFTFELDPKNQGFMRPEDGFYPGQNRIEPTFRKNIEPCLYLLEYADNPYRAIQSKSEKYGLSTPILH